MPLSAQDSNAVVQKLYDSIVDSLTQGGGGSSAAYDPNKTYFTMEPRGRIIDPNDYAGAWTPGNPTGSHDAAAAICDLADEAPMFSARHTAGLATVSDLYQQVLRATVTQEKPISPAQQAAYDKANKFLNTQVPNPDVPGQFLSSQSQVYQTYQTNQTAYQNAVSAFRSAFSAALADPKLKATWPLLAPSLQVPVHQAWHTWRAAQADQVEAALATLETSGRDQVKRAFADAAELFDAYKMGFDEGLSRRRSSLLPSNWYQPGVSNGWPTAHFSNAHAQTNSSSDYTNVSGGGGFSVGLWSFGASGSSSTTHSHSDASADSIFVSYQYAIITIRRPWLTGLLFELPGWNTDAFKKGILSSGSRKGQQQTKFPLLPQAFLVIKNLTITGNFSASEINAASHQISAGGSVGWGPFSVSGSYSHGSKEMHMKGTVNAAGIHVPFVQIVGWVNNILPLSPPN
jgi:hypothetical protein